MSRKMHWFGSSASPFGVPRDSSPKKLSIAPGANAFHVTTVERSDKTPLRNDERGLIITYPQKVSGDIWSPTGLINVDDLRFSLLFWDKLDLAASNMLRVEDSAEIQFLRAAGIVRTSKIIYAGSGKLTTAVRRTPADVFSILDGEQPGMWSLGRGENSILIEDEDQADGGLLVALHNAVLVPTKEVPLEDVLDFRERRRSEMLALRYELETTYQRIINAPDRSLAEVSEFGRLEQALKDHLRASSETQFPLSIGSLTAKLSIKDIWAGSLAFTASNHAMPVIEAAFAGLSAAAISCLMSVGTSFNLKDRAGSARPFGYITSIGSRLR